MPKKDGIRHFHHRGLQVQGEKHPFLLGILLCFLNKGAVLGYAQGGGINDFAFLNLQTRFQDFSAAIGPLKADGQFSGLVQGDRLLRSVKIPSRHAVYVGGGVCGPSAHGMGMLAGIIFNRKWSASIGVAFTKDGVYGRAFDLVVFGLDALFFFSFRFLRIVR